MADLTIRTTLQVEGQCIVDVAERKFVGVELCHDQAHDAQLEAKTIWDKAAVGAQDGFRVMVLSSNQPVELELVSKDGLVERSVMNVSLVKNVALVLGDDAARYDYGSGVGADSFTGQVGEIDLVRVNEVNNVMALIRLRLYK